MPVCPEVAGGLPIPRPPAEIQGGDGNDVLDEKASVTSIEGQDVTAAYLAGARYTLEIARRLGSTVAVLKSRSPSCGNRQIYDGTFSRQLIDGAGVTTALLRRNGIAVYDESEIDKIDLS